MFLPFISRKRHLQTTFPTAKKSPISAGAKNSSRAGNNRREMYLLKTIKKTAKSLPSPPEHTGGRTKHLKSTHKEFNTHNERAHMSDEVCLPEIRYFYLSGCPWSYV
ncbi:hypothetical protein M758_9G100400 [Ceratodon purpureus]|nr:hypothetical protein M758_9G100400 [Ceratodon purpureus]